MQENVQDIIETVKGESNTITQKFAIQILPTYTFYKCVSTRHVFAKFFLQET